MNHRKMLIHNIVIVTRRNVAQQWCVRDVGYNEMTLPWSGQEVEVVTLSQHLLFYSSHLVHLSIK